MIFTIKIRIIEDDFFFTALPSGEIVYKKKNMSPKTVEHLLQWKISQGHCEVYGPDCTFLVGGFFFIPPNEENVVPLRGYLFFGLI